MATLTPGWAANPWARGQLLSYLPRGTGDPEPPYAVVDAWEPPHPLSLPADLCEHLTASAASRAFATGNGSYHSLDLDPDEEGAVIDRFRDANDLWWRLDLDRSIDRWDVHAKRYRAGDRHPPHQDLMAGSARRKLAGSVQLSRPDSYDGGNLVMSHTSHRVAMPRTRGTLVAFPGWTVHEVEPVTRGERWALIVNGWGPPLR